MTSERMQRAYELFEQALERSPEQRDAFLAKACGGDAQLRGEIELLLQHDSQVPDGFMEPPQPDATPRESTPANGHDPLIGSRVGNFVIKAVIGSGGMGTVYAAAQDQPHRTVALKIIKLGMDTAEVLARFDIEREALALMNHPNIAQVFHAGATEQSRPYFAMEYVAGVPIAKHCDRWRLDLEQRLKLFMQVCDAVQHAHQKGVIHRDLKPSNILVDVVDGTATPKVIDFGIAKALNQRLTERTVFTAHGQLIGTPEYMSPEQAEMSGQDIDTRTDIYSLGVLLYELLTGALPFDSGTLRRAAFVEIQRIIREVEPEKPSTKLSSLSQEAAMDRSYEGPSDPETQVRDRGQAQPPPRHPSLLDNVARNRRSDPRTLARDLRGDLDWIVMKCLEKDRARRYETASALAEDIQRHLMHEPVLASPPSTGYRLRKFVRRNTGLVGAVTVVFVVLVAGIVTTGIALGREAEQRRLVDGAREEAQQNLILAEQREQEAIDARAETQARADELQITTEFQQSMLSEIDAEKMGRALFADVRAWVRVSLEVEGVSPEEIDSVLAGFDQLLRRANATDIALKLVGEQVLSRAADTIEADFADRPLIRAALLQTVADTYREIGLYGSAMPLQEAALDDRSYELGEDHPDTLTSINSMGLLLRSMGKHEKAMLYFRQALEGRRRVLGDEHPLTLVSLAELSIQERYAGTQETADQLTLELLGRLFGRRTSACNVQAEFEVLLLAELRKLWSSGEYDAAGTLIRERIAPLTNIPVIKERLYDWLGALAMLCFEEGDLDTAEPLLREALEGNRRVLGDDHLYTLNTIGEMGQLLEVRGRLAEAESHYREALERSSRVLGDNHPHTITLDGRMSDLLESMDKHEEALPHYLEALEWLRRALSNDRDYDEELDWLRRVFGDDHPITLAAINKMGSQLESMGKWEEALPYYREALDGVSRVLGDDHPNTLWLINGMGERLESMGRIEEAMPYFCEALVGCRRVLGDDDPYTLFLVGQMGERLESLGKYEEALPYYREALDGARRVHGSDHPHTLSSIHNMGCLLRDLERLEEAEALGAEAAEGARRSLPEGHCNIAVFLGAHGETLSQLERYTEAEAALLEAHGLLEATFGAKHERTINVVKSLVDLYEAWHAAEPGMGYDTKAAEWRAKLEQFQSGDQLEGTLPNSSGARVFARV